MGYDERCEVKGFLQTETVACPMCGADARLDTVVVECAIEGRVYEDVEYWLTCPRCGALDRWVPTA